MTTWSDFLAAQANPEATAAAFAGLDAAANSAALFDLSPLALISAEGPDAAGFLHGQFTNDIKKLAVGAVQRNAWCSAKGRMLASFLVCRIAPESFWLLIPADLAANFAKRLRMFVLRSKVTVTDLSERFVRFGWGGPQLARVSTAVGVQTEPWRLATCQGGWIAQLDGNRCVAAVPLESAPAIWQSAQQAATATSFAAWQWLTLRAGEAWITTETVEQFVPQMVNWELVGGVNFQKGCYPGQEIVARTQYLGKLKRRMYLAKVPAASAAAPGTSLFSDDLPDQACGVVANAAPSPAGDCEVLAVMQMQSAAAGKVHLGRPDGPLLEFLPLPYPIPADGGDQTA